MFLTSESVSLVAMGYARNHPENSSRMTWTAFSRPFFSFRTMIKSVAMRSPKAVTGSSEPLSAKGSALSFVVLSCTSYSFGR